MENPIALGMNLSPPDGCDFKVTSDTLLPVTPHICICAAWKEEQQGRGEEQKAECWHMRGLLTWWVAQGSTWGQAGVPEGTGTLAEGPVTGHTYVAAVGREGSCPESPPGGLAPTGLKGTQASRWG